MTTAYSNQNINVIACGGAGSNILYDIASAATDPIIGFAHIVPCYVDTSLSNMRNKLIPEEQVYLFEGIDGSGKVRSMNYEDITKQVKSILQKFKPTVLNVIMHSASGGSGSVIAPVLVSELKARGQQVIVILIGSTDTRIEIENTIKTLKSYESIADKRDSPVVVYYIENSVKETRAGVDNKARRAISFITSLYSGQNDELDSADLRNWLDYTNITKSQARLASINFVASEDELSNIGTVISVATLAMREHATRFPTTPAYQCVGYAPVCWRPNVITSMGVMDNHPLHFCISDDFIITSANRLNKALKDIDDLFNSRNARSSILEKGDNRVESGLVL